jgi:hypothetical protein
MEQRFKNLYQKRERSNKLAEWNPTIMAPSANQLTSTITRVTQAFLHEIDNEEGGNLKDYIKMARKDPLVGSCIELKCLRAAILFGKYSHSNSKVERWVQSNFDDMKGSLHHKIGRLGSAMPLGFSAAEIIFHDRYRGEWRLDTLNILDQTRISFEGKNGEIYFLRYREPTGVDIRVPYPKVLHIVNGYASNLGEYDAVYGYAESCAANQYYKAKQAVLTEMMISAKNAASGMWLGQADSNETVQLVDIHGRPMVNPDGSPKTQSAVHVLQQQMLNLENNSVIVTDLKNRVQALVPDKNDIGWQNYINILDTGILRSYGVPKLLLDEGTSSTSANTLGRQHKTVLDSQVESIVTQIRDQMIERVVKPLLIYNFGITDDFGTFKLDEVQDQESVSLRVQNIISAVSAQIIPAQNIHVVNALYDSLGLPTVNETEQGELLQKQLMKTYLENAVFAGDPTIISALTGQPPAPAIESGSEGQ